jgi:hypothetical protein
MTANENNELPNDQHSGHSLDRLVERSRYAEWSIGTDRR